MEAFRQTLGHYEILHPIGAGGMGEVFVARDPSLGRKVAIKMLPQKLASDRETLSRFTQEARSASALNHPNIVTIHEVGAESGAPYIVMEYIEGTDLRSLVADGPMPVRKALDIAVQIAEGLAAAHERGIVHRDLKPENLMVTRDGGYVKILDFGLAKVMGPSPDGDNTLQLDAPGTNPGTILGTVGYMSPEQARGRRLDFRSDQFALGAILYELVTGACAFDGETAMDTLAAILHEEPPPVTRINPRVPTQLHDIIKRLLEKHPDDRYASTRDLAREIRLLRDRVAAEESGFHTLTPPPHPRRTMMAVAGALGLAIFLGAAFWIAKERVAPTDAATPPVQNAALSKKYLAVLRFKDLTGDANGQLVVDGFAETLTARLAHYPAVQVMRPQGAEPEGTDLPKVARDLGANIVLTGTMQRDGQRLRVSYSLVDIASGTQKRDLVDGPVTDLFGIQDEVARSVAESMSLGTPAVKTASLDPSISQRRYLEALGNLRRYDDEQSVDNAVAILEEISRNSSSASVEAALGRAYLYKYQLSSENSWADKAAEACERALRSDPQNPDVHTTLGELRRQTGRYDEALEQYRRALAQHPTSVDAILGMAEAYNASDRDAEAEKWYARAIELQPNYWATYNKMGAFYASSGRHKDAIRMFQRVVDLLPDNIRGYNNLGAAYELTGQHDQALRVFSQSLQRRPSYEAYANIGTILFGLGRYSDSASAFEKAAELAPKAYVVWQNLGEAYVRLPDGAARARVAFQRAVSLGEEALKVNPSDPAVHASLAFCLANLGEHDRARRAIQAALRIDPSNLQSKLKAAKVATLRNDPAAAMPLLREIIDAGVSPAVIAGDPDFIPLRAHPDFQQLVRRRP